MKPHKLLIVEDEMIISANLEESLRRLGYVEIDQAFSAQEALDNLMGNKYDAVLMDVKLNDEIDGIDVINEVKRYKDVPVIYVTGNSDETTLSKAKRTLPAGFITKPVTDHNLKIQLELLLYHNFVSTGNSNSHGKSTSNFVGDLSGLHLNLFMDGTIVSISPQIKKLTGIPAFKYSGTNISNAVFDNDFFMFLCEIIEESIISEKRSFYGKVFSPFLGERILRADVNYENFHLCAIHFTDLTAYSDKFGGRETSISLAIATKNKTLMKIISNIRIVAPHVKISALLPDLVTIKEYLLSSNDNTLLIDIDFFEEPATVDWLHQAKSIKKVILASPIEDRSKFRRLNAGLFDGFVAKGASDATMVEMFHHLQRDEKYYDKTLQTFLS